jgi:ADP-heptose:LPS heptosyltransferase
MNVCANPLPRPPDADRILVVRLGALGDVVRTLPAAHALRSAYPGAHLGWLVEPAAHDLVAAQPWVDEVLRFPRDEISAALRSGRWLRAAEIVASFVRALRRRRFDLAVDFHSIGKSALLVRASGARERIGYAPPHGREASWWLATRRARLSAARISRFARNQGLVEFLGLPVRARPAALRVDAEARRRAAESLGDGARPVALHPGTSAGTPYQRWDPEGYAAVARGLGVPCIVTFGPDREERVRAEAVVAASGGAARLAPPTGSLAELAALLECCRAFVGSDSGPLHLASAVGTPVVQLLGPTDPVENEPYPATPMRRVRVPVACSPCRRGCAAAPCMRRIEPRVVLAAARELLAESEAGRAPGLRDG